MTGQFLKGHKGGPGNPRARQVAAFRTAIYEAVSLEDHKEIAQALAEKAKETGANQDPVLRDRLASTYIEAEIMRYLGMGTLTRFLGGAQPGPAESAFKLYWSEYHKRITELSLDILGADAMVPSGPTPNGSFHADNPGAPNMSGSWVGTFFNARAGTIYAGTSQVQRNILGEMVLGLPKEPRPKD